MKKRSLKTVFGFVVVMIGLGLFFYPDIKTWYMERQSEKVVTEFNEQMSLDVDGETEQENRNPNMVQPSDELLASIQDYNKQIYEDGQAGYKDSWSVTQAPDVLDGLENLMFGYIEVPTMDMTLPLYVGASETNLAKGAAVLGETSIPIGGDNTNSVIAGHRGYGGAPYFLYIEKLSVGDSVYITNPWETLIYRVESIDIVNPNDSDRVKIQEGKDMVTLITCHPYRSHGKYRYVVYCVREGSVIETKLENEKADYIEASDGTMYEASSSDIERERLFRRCGALIIVVIILISLIAKKRKSKKDCAA